MFFMEPIIAQDITHNMSSHTADSLSKLLNENIPAASRISFLLRLAEYNILKPGEARADLDSASVFISQADRLKNRSNISAYDGSIALAKAYLFHEKGQKQEGKIALEKAISISKANNDKLDLGLAYYELAQYYDFGNRDQLPEKIHLTELAICSFEQSGNIELRAFSLKMLADLYNFSGDTYKALEIIRLSLKAYQSVHYKKLQSVYDLFSSIYYFKSDFIQALKYELAALETAQSTRDTTMQLCEINNHIGLIYHKLNNDEKAIDFYKRALLTAEKYHDNSNIITLMYNTVNSYIYLNRPSEALYFMKGIPVKDLESKDISIYYAVPMSYLSVYTSLKRYYSALFYSNQLISLLYSNHLAAPDLTHIYASLIKYQIASKKYASARKYLKKNDSILHGLNEPISLSRNYELWFKLDTAQGDYKSAIRYMLLRNKLNDSVSNENKSRQLKQIAAFYETEQKEEAIKLLQIRGRLQQTKLQHAVNTKNWIAGLVVMLFILLLVSIDRYRVKKRINKLLEVKQARISSVNRRLVAQKNDLLAEKDDLLSENEWLLNEVHHRVKNNLHTVISLLESQAVFLKNDALKAIEKSQHRIYAMSLIHQKLYQAENLKTVDISAFIPEFIRYLNDSYNTHKRISFELEIEPLNLGVSQAIPIALIINEAITNAIQYAFPGKSSGTIQIVMNRSAEKVTLVIADNGVGIDPAKAETHSPDSLGLVLMNGLSGDIGGKITVENNQGTRISIVFNAEPAADNIL
jgi:two-component sensor histidine kinase